MDNATLPSLPSRNADRRRAHPKSQPTFPRAQWKPRQWAAGGLLLSLSLMLSVGPAYAAVFTVNSTDNADDGSCNAAHCSLREAINAANSNPGPDEIDFDISGPSPHVIALAGLTPLPSLTDAGTTIDGTTQPDYSGSPVIVIQPWTTPPAAPPLIPLPAEGLWIEADNSTIRGLSIIGFDDLASPTATGIVVNSGTGNLIELCYVGLDASGAAVGNGTGIRLGPIGQTVRDNVISGNEIGIEIYGGEQTIHGNWIGLDPSGTFSVPNVDGIVVSGFYPPTTGPGGSLTIGGSAPGEGNVISGNSWSGLRVTNASTGISILGNRVGTDVGGVAAVPNMFGIVLENTTGVVVGGAGAGEGNLISGNTGHGIWVKDFDAAGTFSGPAEYAHIMGNTVGLAADGSVLPNGSYGVLLNGSHHRVGGDLPGEGNILSGNAFFGLRITNGEENTVIGNWIGTDATGVAELGNGGGVKIQTPGSLTGNTIAYNREVGVRIHAADTELRENVIVGNEGAGIDLFSAFPWNVNNTISQNEMHDNDMLGIDLPLEGVTTNDPGDVDTGANDRLNFPEFTSLSMTEAAGTACYGCVVELFLADGDPSQYGEGMTFLASTTAAPDGTWSAPISGVGFCTPVTATATDLSGNTSEFAGNARANCLLFRPVVVWFVVAGGVMLAAGAAGLRGRTLGHPVLRYAAAGAAAGAVVTAALVVGVLALPSVELVSPPERAAPAAPGLASCTQYLDEESLRPRDGAVFEPNDEPAFGWVTAASLPSGQYRWVVELHAADGSTSSQTTPGNRLELSSFGVGSIREGNYAWVIRGERADPGSDLWLPLCGDDPSMYFRIGAPNISGPPPWVRGASEGLPVTSPTGTPPTPPTATLTPTPTATIPPTLHPPTRTVTPSATPPPDTTGPSIKSVSDSPDPIYVNQPAGCSPNTSIVSVSVSDPSGVASAVVLFFHTTIGSVPMSNAGGDNWQATLGPHSGVGDGTVDYQIHTTDSLGNSTDSAFYQITVLACIP